MDVAGTAGMAGFANSAGTSGLNLGGTSADGTRGTAGMGVGSSTGGAAQSFCDGTGPAIPLGTMDECTGDIAKRTFRFAICSCTNINFNGAVVTDSKDSATNMASATAASVGVDGTYNGASDRTKIGGSLWTDGDTAFSGHAISGQLQCGGNLIVDGTSQIGADANLVGGVQGALSVDGALHITAGMPHDGVSAKGGVVEQPVMVPQACDCSKPLDIPGIVEFFKAHNDDAVINLDPDSLAQGDAEQTLTLPCGRYFLSSIAGGAALTVHVTGRAVIAIEGSLIHNLTSVDFVVDKGAELDLFVGHDILLSGAA